MSWTALALPMAHGLNALDLLGLFGHFLLLSMLAIGGAITTAPDMHRMIVDEHGWITDAQFTSSIAIAQAAPGPNILFVAVLGWNVAGPLGACATMAGIMLPSTTLALAATRWGRARQESIGVRAFTNGMAPLTLGLLLATGWVLSQPFRDSLGATLLVLLTVLVMLRTRLSPMWMIAVGAVVGMLGWA
jgi:chromate transporter